MAIERREAGLSVAIVSPNLLNGGPNGVADFITGIKPYLEDQGVAVRIFGPAKHVWGEDKNEDADYTIGQTVWMPPHDGTKHRPAVSFNKGRARNLLLHNTPDLVVMHQPLEGTVGHTLMSAAPRREDGKRIPAFVAHHHANSENLHWLTRLALEVGRNVRRPRFGEYGWPIGMTPGFVRTVLGESDGRIAVSNATANFWKGIDKDEHEYKVIYNGIDVKELTHEGPKIEAWDDGKQTILFAGRHDPRKGLEYLMEAYRLLRLGRNDIKLKITGRGQTTHDLQRLVQEQNLPDVEFLGVLSREELVKAYRTADVFVSPATGGEGFGRTLAEALAVGTLTVGSDIEGYREVIGPDATGGREFASMANPKDPDDLASKIGKMLNFPEPEKTRLGKEGAQYVRDNYSWPIIARQTVNYYDQVMREHGMPGQWPIRKIVKEREGKARERREAMADLPAEGTIFER